MGWGRRICGVENHTWVFLNFSPRELVNGNPLELRGGPSGMGWELLTIEVEAVLIQRVGAQPSDAMGLPAQLMEQLLGRQTWATGGGLAIGAEEVHPCLGAILHRPGKEEVDLWGMQFSWHLSTCGHYIPQILCYSLLGSFIVSLPGHTLSLWDLHTSSDFCLEVSSLLFLPGQLPVHLSDVNLDTSTSLKNPPRRSGTSSVIATLVIHYVSMNYLSLFPSVIDLC